MADLAKFRLTGDQPPITDVAFDYFAPFIISQGRKTKKRQGVVFLCLASRAIPVEVENTSKTSSFSYKKQVM